MLAAIAAAVVMVILGVVARSDSADWGRRGQHAAQESAFLHDVALSGLDVTPDQRARWLAVGEDVCAQLRAGANGPEAARSYRGHNPSATDRQAAAVVSAAIYLCPDQSSAASPAS